MLDMVQGVDCVSTKYAADAMEEQQVQRGERDRERERGGGANGDKHENKRKLYSKQNT